MDCFVALAPLRKRFAFVTGNDGKSRHTCAFPRRSRARVVHVFFARKNRGRRECRAPDAPAASCAKVESTRVRNHGHTGSPGIPYAMVLTVSFALSPATNSFCHRHQRIWLVRTRSGRLRLRKLSISNGCQDHTTSPSAKASFVCTRVNRSQTFVRPAITSRAPTLPRPPHPVPNVRDDREPPLFGERDGKGYEVIWLGGEWENFYG
jgi:hypothetical protein